jgi:hypothetical protein
MKHIPQDWSVLHSVWDWDPLNVFTPIHRSRTDTPIAVHLGTRLGLFGVYCSY